MKQIKLKRFITESKIATIGKNIKLPNGDTGMSAKLSEPFKGSSEIVIVPTSPTSNFPSIICDLNGKILDLKSDGINYVDVLSDIGFTIERSDDFNTKSLPTTHPEYGLEEGADGEKFAQWLRRRIDKSLYMDRDNMPDLIKLYQKETSKK